MVECLEEKSRSEMGRMEEEKGEQSLLSFAIKTLKDVVVLPI